MGTVFRCPRCNHVMMRIAHLAKVVVLDMSGIVVLRLRIDG
jgi:hypothetical protein